MQDVIVYTGAKQAAETLLFAAHLGTAEIMILFPKHDQANDEAYAALEGLVKGVRLTKGLLVKDAREAQKHAQRYDALVGQATRDLAEGKQVSYVHRAETLEDKDKTHRRGSGMNQVIAKLLADKKKTYVFDLSLLLGSPEQAKLLGRMRQNKRILSKYKVATLCCSFATTPLQVRAPKERSHFLTTL